MKSKLLLGLLALLLPFQFQAFAETGQGTITAIDSSGHNFDLVQTHGDTEAGYAVKVGTAPGVQYVGVDSFDGLQVGDYVEISTVDKSKTGSSLQATRIARQFVAAQNVRAASAMRVTQTTVTTTTTEPAVIKNVPVFVQTPAATTYKSTETVKDGGTVSSQTTTTTTY